MMDPRIRKLADVLIGHSTRLQAGEHLLIELFDAPESIGLALVEAARAAGGHPHVCIRSNRIMRAVIEQSHDDGLATWAESDLDWMRRMDAYIGIRGASNANEMAGIADDRQKAWGRLYMKPVHFGERVNNTRWCVLRWPTPSMAQLASVDTRSFEDFYFNVCTLDYGRMTDAASRLSARMDRTDRVRIQGPGDTDLSFSIRDVPVIACTGSHNIPDGECFTAPVRDSVEGVIHFNTPTIYQGTSFENVRLAFREGRVVEASSDRNGDRLQAVLDTDEGSRYVGEFAIGFNPYVLEPMRDILFDEKIAGSLHFTPGQAYEDADNGNRSEIHWDLVLIQRPEYGGGTISFDGEVVRRDGRFVVEDLAAIDELG